MPKPQPILDHILDLKTRYALCICGKWRADLGPWLTAPPPPRHLCTPATCPECRAALKPTIRVCDWCKRWDWADTPTFWRDGPAPDALATTGICHVCREKVEAEADL